MNKFLLIILLILEINSVCSDSLTITFLGDTYFGENYRFSDIETNAIDEYGYDYYFENVKNLLLSSDFVFANLETPLTNNSQIIINSKEKYSHYSNSDSAPFYLVKYNIGAVTIANNHVLDLGFDGLNSTINSLNHYKISSFGAGLKEQAALKPFNKKFVTGGKEFDLYVFGAYWYRTRFDLEKNYYAKDDKGGVSMLNPEKIIAEIKRIKEINPKAYIVIYPHWGSNYKERNEYQKEVAHKLIDGGADLIVGHGAHTVQQIENYNGKWIIYNLGNFIFNAPGRYGSTKAKPYGFIAKVIIIDNTKLLRLYPIFTNNLETDCQIRFLDEDEFEDCYKYASQNNSIKKINGVYFQISLN